VNPLSNTEVAVLLTIQDYLESHDKSPTLQEIADHIEQSRNSVHTAVARLEALGYIDRTPKKWRTIKLVERGRNEVRRRKQRFPIESLYPQPHREYRR